MNNLSENYDEADQLHMYALEGATPNVEAKKGSNSEVIIQSENSNIDSLRSFRQEYINQKFVQRESNSLKYDTSEIKSKKNIHESQFKDFREVNSNQSDRHNGKLKEMLDRQMQLRFIENLITSAGILTAKMLEERKPLFLRLYQNYSKEDNKSKKRTSQQQQLSKLEQIFFFSTFLPSSNLTKYWNFFSILFSLFTLWLSPIMNFFFIDKENYTFRVVEIIFTFIIIDGLITCNKAILLQGELVINRKLIVNNYLKKQIIFDFGNLIIWIFQYIHLDYYSFQQILCIIQVLIIIKTVYSKIYNFVDCLNLSSGEGELLDLFFLILSLFYFVHIIACLWYFIATISDYEVNWIIKYNLNDYSIWIKYDYAIYWAMMTMVTVGYGDITAANPIEVLFSNFTMFISSLVFAYSMNSIGMIIKSLYDSRSLYKRQLILINNYMSSNYVDESIANRVRNFLKNQVGLENNNQTEAQLIIDNLPSRLKSDVNLNIKLRIAKQISILTNNFSSGTIINCAQLIEQVSFIENDIIYSPEEHQKENYLYYIDIGTAHLVELRTQQTLQVFNQGDTFGEYSFITGFDQKFVIQCKSFLKLYRLSRTEFIKVIHLNQKDKEIYYQMKDKIIFQGSYSLLNKKCSICKKQTHLNQNCDVISYQPDLEKIIKREGFIFQYRKKIRRIERAKIRTLIELDVIDIINQGIKQTVEQFQQQQQEQQSNYNENDTQSNLSDTKKREFTSRQTDYKTGQIREVSINDLSPDLKPSDQKEQQHLNINKNKFEMRRISQTGKLTPTLQLSNKQIQIEEQQRKISFSQQQQRERENTQITQFEQSSQQIIQYKSAKTVPHSILYMFETEDFTKISQKQIKCEIDKAQSYQFYLPHNNLEGVLNHYNKMKYKHLTVMFGGIRKAFKYTFYYRIAKLANGMRQLTNQANKRQSKPASAIRKAREHSLFQVL